jgi:4-hydroxybenzoate polyprenyltransferase
VPLLKINGVTPLLPKWIFCIITASSTLIAAAGYIINDYFDIKIDQINKPNRVIIGNKIQKSSAMKIYIILSSVGLIFGAVASIFLVNSTLFFIFLFVTGALWFYSSTYKRQFLIGNIIISLCAALTVMITMIAEADLHLKTATNIISNMNALGKIYIYAVGFAIFAFIFTLIREIVKDLEDIEGDREAECRTVPIVLGECRAKIIATSIIVIAVAAIFLIVSNFNIINDASISFRYALFGIAIPSVITLMMLWSKSTNNYANASSMLKFIMIAGIFYTAILYINNKV